MNIFYFARLKVIFNIKIIITYRNRYLNRYFEFISERLFLYVYSYYKCIIYIYIYIYIYCMYSTVYTIYSITIVDDYTYVILVIHMND